MATDPDDDAALAWAGDETPTPTGRVAAQPESAGRVAAQPHIETSPTNNSRVELVETSPTKKPIPAPLLITYGVLGGLYLIYTIGWVLTVSQGAPPRATVFDDIMFRVQQGLAVASPAIWFGAVFLLTRGRKPLVRLLWLLVGLAIVIPWPTVLGGMTVTDEKSIADADDPVEAVIVDDATQATRGRYGWLSLTVAALFGLVYAYFLWQAVSLLVQLPTNLAALGLGGDRIPWWLLVLGVLIPPIVFGVAAAVGRRQNVGRKAVIFVVGLAVVSGLGLSVIALTYILIFGPIVPAAAT